MDVTEKYNMGVKFENGDIIAKVFIERTEKMFSLDKDDYNKHFNFKISIRFLENFNYIRLKERGIVLDDYMKNGKSWEYQLNKNDDLMVELNELTEFGFDIFNHPDNKDYQKLVASVL